MNSHQRKGEGRGRRGIECMCNMKIHKMYYNTNSAHRMMMMMMKRRRRK